MSYDIRFRRHVLKIREQEGLSFTKVSERFGISKQTVYNWSKRIEEKKNRSKPATKIDMEALAFDVKIYADSYRYERARRLNVSIGCINHALKRLGVSYKKNTYSSQVQERRTLCFLSQT